MTPPSATSGCCDNWPSASISTTTSSKASSVVWKPDLKNRKAPEYGEPAIITAVFPVPAIDHSDESTGSPYFHEPLSTVIGLHREDDLLEFYVDGRRFEPVAE